MKIMPTFGSNLWALLVSPNRQGAHLVDPLILELEAQDYPVNSFAMSDKRVLYSQRRRLGRDSNFPKRPLHPRNGRDLLAGHRAHFLHPLPALATCQSLRKTGNP
jgi:hypothetical protein